MQNFTTRLFRLLEKNNLKFDQRLRIMDDIIVNCAN